ncbi:demethoxyubiquinone hydroxylase family protein [Acidihalobacter ferrooxydans]|uniref:3-demethoxyubiquinol 3-hydroxylase n=2 Tax=Acidihalobacter ferrooxydans TaxID=1765967 RepID=A0A1P8UJY9_9GAMM|nr:demethoxyubiquinone hydroxylase family protein [Acidihalobacter ferrooxydans]
MRTLSPIDRLIDELDHSLRTLYGTPYTTARPDPAEGFEEAQLSDAERALAGDLLRVDHAGEVSAQGLYRGQALTARDAQTRAQMAQSALEENDHLQWCEARLDALGTHKSLLGPFWYWGSYGIGACAGLLGDRWSLGFIDETEQQVVRHLSDHLDRLPAEDHKSRAVLEQMREDETHHAHKARAAGGATLPWPARKLMHAVSRVMTTAASRI